MNQLFDAITWNLNGIGIEQESFRRIDAEAAPEIRARFSDAEWHVARRLVHTTADFAILDQLVYKKIESVDDISIPEYKQDYQFGINAFTK